MDVSFAISLGATLKAKKANWKKAFALSSDYLVCRQSERVQSGDNVLLPRFRFKVNQSNKT
jgi:hypothetical protein